MSSSVEGNENDIEIRTKPSTGSMASNQRTTSFIASSPFASSASHFRFKNLVRSRPSGSARPNSNSQQKPHKHTNLPSTATAATDQRHH